MLGDLSLEVVQSIARQVAEADIDSLYSFRHVCKSFLRIVDDWMVEPHASDILITGKILGASMAAYLVHRPLILDKLRIPCIVVGFTNQYGDGYEWCLEAAADLVPLMFVHYCDPTSCELFQGAKDNRLNLIGLEAEGVVCPYPLRRYKNPDSVYLQALAEREILPYVFFGGVERRDFGKRIKDQCLTNSAISTIARDIMERLEGKAEGRQQCLRVTMDRIVAALQPS
ncbi:hypothetical protein F5Y09DRAFT_134392 [Xylaria sp. FL1042]|nr:hypothetical protein F5Y09DRAFT_134392 [Xylaria sp. FL1042]